MDIKLIIGVLFTVFVFLMVLFSLIEKTEQSIKECIEKYGPNDTRCTTYEDDILTG
jgi:hypothetical protein